MKSGRNMSRKKRRNVANKRMRIRRGVNRRTQIGRNIGEQKEKNRSRE